ncbi:MAG TPA: glycosyl hydrolase family 32, partial [Protaetiibacter sp.]|nr:glycosyl hydrolase family 32 [Protaetiibacter sp.]
MLELPDHWVWDSWYVTHEGVHHAFFLRASRALQDPEQRHERASIGHAISTDYANWTLLPDALVASDGPAWDDLATWTGSTVRGQDGRWYLFYTGISREHRTGIQNIGVAVSDDLVNWVRHGTAPIVQPDSRWYETGPSEAWPERAWRDPWVFPDPAGGWHMLLTARAAAGVPRDRGVVGHAWSPDLLRWECRPPLSAP